LIAGLGWNKGFAVPLHRGGTRFGLVSLAGKGVDPSPEDRARLAAACEFFLTRIKALDPHAGSTALPGGLTARELACVRLVAGGHTDATVARELGIAKPTAHQHVETARKRFNARSRAHLVAIAVSLGLVTGE
jgi:DNA-binding CsgD family transcriptional regulator